MFEHMNIKVNFNNADFSDICFSSEDKMILKELGKQVAEISARPIMAERNYG